MKEVPQQPAVTPPQSSDRDERRIVATVVRLVMRLPRLARYGLLLAALGGASELGGLDVLDMFISDVVEAPEAPQQPPSRAQDPALRLERADLEALEALDVR